MRYPSGQVVSALCQCDVFTGVYWKDTPWMQFQPVNMAAPPPIPATITCHACGYPMRADWRCCPKCGRAIA
jgi:hypothetical protein